MVLPFTKGQKKKAHLEREEDEFSLGQWFLTGGDYASQTISGGIFGCDN